MSNLTLVKSENFGNVECNFFQDNKQEVWMTRTQVGEALEYKNPNESIKNIHLRHQDRIDKFSRVAQIDTPLGGNQEATLYSAKGVYEICRWSRQPKADAFMDFVWEVMEGLRTGTMHSFKPQSEQAKLLIQQQRAEAMLLNAKTRQAKLILDMQKSKTLSPIAVELLGINALEIITDQKIDYRPKTEKHYTATEIAKELGISPNMVGRIANKHNLKSEEYGMTILDKSPHSTKQVESFVYNEKGRQELKNLRLEVKL